MGMKWLHNKKFQKRVWIFLAIIILPAFVLWGSGSVGRNQGQIKSAGKIAGKNVTPDEFQDALLASRNQMILRFGRDFVENQKFFNWEDRAWERLILLREAEKRKIKVPDQEVIELITTAPLFQKKDRFDNDTYIRMVAYMFRTQPRRFEEQIRQNLIMEKLYDSITATVTVGEEEIKKAYKEENEQISIAYLNATYADYAKDLEVSTETLKEYFQKNPLAFKLPLSYNLEYVASESEETMKTVFNRLYKKDPLDTIAKELGLEYKETGFFTASDPVPGIGWLPQLTTAIAKAQKGEILPPVRMDKNILILRVKELREPFVPEFEAVMEKVKKAYLQEASRKIAREKTESCLKKIRDLKTIATQPPDLEKTAKECGLKQGKTGLFAYGSYIDGVGASDNFFTAARDLPEGGFSEILETPEGLYIVTRTSLVPVDEKKYLEAKPKFSEGLLQKKKSEYFIQFIEGLKKHSQGPFVQAGRK
jgi:hypothetical protein